MLFDPNRGLADGVYILDNIGARIWQLIVDQGYKTHIIDSLLLEYNVDETTVTKAVDELLTQLLAEGFIFLSTNEET